jgi:hypothetical protein
MGSAHDAILIPIAPVAHDHAFARAAIIAAVGIAETELEALGGRGGRAHHGQDKSKAKLFHRLPPA